ncbi:MAG TPA: acetyl-CoA carboxylase biotin carboxylase subunit, partial [Polyangia bacterium]
IVQYRQPHGPYVRDDSGIYEGSEISVFYDPMISKLITWGATRAEAIERMERALMEYRVGGIKTNLAFHRRVLREPDFRSGKYSTAYIEAHKELLAKPIALDEQEDALDAALAAAAMHALEAAPQPAAAANGAAAATATASTERTAWQRSSRF